MRTFLAIELPIVVREQLQGVQARLRALPALACFRWVPAENVHLTLRFLGETDPRQQQLITQGVQRLVDRQRPLTLAVGGAGVFPNFRAPNIIWLGVQGGLAELAQFQAKLERVAQQAGFAPETRPFSPHLTIARAKRDVARPQLAQAGQALKAAIEAEQTTPVPFRVDQVVFLQSELPPGGARYTPLQVFQLGGA